MVLEISGLAWRQVLLSSEPSCWPQQTCVCAHTRAGVLPTVVMSVTLFPSLCLFPFSLPSSLFLLFWDRVSCWPGWPHLKLAESSNWPHTNAEESLEFILLLDVGITAMHWGYDCMVLYGFYVLGARFSLSCVCSRHFTHWTISPDLNLFFFFFFFVKAYSTWYSQALSHPGTNHARPCLASEIRWDRVCSGWYGRRLKSYYITLALLSLTLWTGIGLTSQRSACLWLPTAWSKGRCHCARLHFFILKKKKKLRKNSCLALHVVYFSKILSKLYKCMHTFWGGEITVLSCISELTTVLSLGELWLSET